MLGFSSAAANSTSEIFLDLTESLSHMGNEYTELTE